MKVSLEDVSDIQKRLSIEIPAETVNKHYNQTIAQFRKSVAVPGFRKGRVPKSILEREYGEHIKNEVLERLIKETLADAIKEADVTMLLEPQFDSSSEIKEGQDFKYSVLIDVEPEIELPEYKGIELTKPAVEVTDEEIDEQLRQLQKHFGKVTPVDEQRPVQEGDIAIIDYKAFIDGQEVDDLAMTDYYVEVGSGNLNEEFEKGLIGMEKGEEKEITITYPEDAVNSKVAGKTVTYRVSLKNIQTRDLPELNDEFAQSIGIGLKTLDDLKQKIREQIKKDKEEAAESALRQQVFDQLLEKADFPVSERLIEKKLDQMIDNIAGHLQERGMNLERAGLDETRLREKMREDAVKQVKTELILDKIAETEKIEIEGEELSQYADYVDQNYQDMGVDRSQLQSAIFESVLPKLRAKKTLDFIIENAKIKEAGPEAETVAENS